jgi:arylsulfatase
VEFDYERAGPANGGNITMFINGNKVAEGKVEPTMPSRFSDDETLDVGLDAGSPVSDQYASPFKFTGMIDRVEVNSAAGE